MEHETPVDPELTLESAPESAPETDEFAQLVAQLIAARDEAVTGRQRALADFANFQRRSLENESRARTGGLVSLARALMPVLDHFDLALAQDLNKVSVEQMAKSIDMTRAELQKVLENNGFVRIEPVPGTPFDPMQHDAVMRQAVEGIAASCITMRFQTGWKIGESVLRPAKVAVSPDA